MGADNALLLYGAELPAEGFDRNSQKISQFRAVDGQRQYGRFRRFACISARKAPSLPKKSWKGVTTAACGLLSRPLTGNPASFPIAQGGKSDASPLESAIDSQYLPRNVTGLIRTEKPDRIGKLNLATVAI